MLRFYFPLRNYRLIKLAAYAELQSPFQFTSKGLSMKRIMFATCLAVVATAAVAQDTSQLRPYNEPADKAHADTSRSKGVIRAPAPKLTSVAILAVGSTQHGDWEYTYGKFTTTYDHGGAQLRVAAEEWGYAGSRIARFNGAVLPSSANYASEPICGGTPSAPVGCSPGQTVVGFIQYWNLDGLGQSGNFQYQATSVNGGGTYSTAITIQ